MLREEFLRLLREDQAFREEVRRQLPTEELLALPQSESSAPGTVVGGVLLTINQDQHGRIYGNSLCK